MLQKLKNFKNKVAVAILGAAVAANAAAVDQLDSLKNTLDTVQEKASTLSGVIIGIVLVGVVMAIVIGWAKKSKKAG